MTVTEGLGNLNLNEYRSWIADLQRRYRACQIKAAVSVNSALLETRENEGKQEITSVQQLVEKLVRIPWGQLQGYVAACDLTLNRP